MSNPDIEDTEFSTGVRRMQAVVGQEAPLIMAGSPELAGGGQ